ncbi:MAG: hypothetical protein ACREV1_02055 [Gammaproteobacteria bacterium]
MISGPDLAAPRSHLADWLEICAVFSPHGAGQANISSLYRKSGDEDHFFEPDEDGEILDAEIVNRDLEDNSDRIADEVGSRATALGDDYPFLVSLRPFHLKLKCEFEDLSLPSCVYLFLLLMSGAGDKVFVHSAEIDSLMRKGRTLFHACASVGVAGLLRNAETVWFGFPREDRSGFLQALQNLCERFGCGKAKERIPPGFPAKPKDDEIDIVGWRAYRGRRNGNLIVLCQAATGLNWKDKSILTQIDAFKEWFDIKPYAKATGAIAIPFPAYHEVCEYPEDGFDVAMHNAIDRAQSRLGVLIDRGRIVEAVQGINDEEAQSANIDAIEKLPELKQWVSDAIAAINAA